jgi:anti-sigma factor RsiW
VTCPCAEQTQRHFDGELGPAEAAVAAAHVAHCASCQAQVASAEHARHAARAAWRGNAPAALRARVLALIDADGGRTGSVPAPSRPRRAGFRWATFVSGALSGAMATAVLIMLAPWTGAGRTAELVSDHVTALSSGRAISVASSDRHTVKPWFAGRADVSPIVVDLAVAGYPLLGGRVDRVAGYRAAVAVYGHGAHVISVFAWPAGRQGAPAPAERRGYRILYWQSADIDYAAVSDTGWDELGELRRRLAQAGEPIPPR